MREGKEGWVGERREGRGGGVDLEGPQWTSSGEGKAPGHLQVLQEISRRHLGVRASTLRAEPGPLPGGGDTWEDILPDVSLGAPVASPPEGLHHHVGLDHHTLESTVRYSAVQYIVKWGRRRVGGITWERAEAVPCEGQL